MIYSKVQLINDRPDVFLEIFAADKTKDFVRDAILIIPGGGYGTVCSDREGEPIAMAFMPYGFNAFVLHYSVGEKARFPQPLIEASLAMKYIKDNAEEFGIDKDRVFVTGFSAGGHLCASLGIMWHLDEIYKAADMEYGYNKPAGMIPVYPVVSSDQEICHMGSYNNIIGTDADENLRKRYSPELYVDERSVPAFIVHTAADNVVNVRNSIRLGDAYAKRHIPFEMHIFADAPHGMSLCNEITAGGFARFINPHNAKWVELAVEWTRTVGR